MKKVENKDLNAHKQGKIYVKLSQITLWNQPFKAEVEGKIKGQTKNNDIRDQKEQGSFQYGRFEEFF
ncbi:MAG: hypothetical protein WC649_04315 [Desulfobacteria bacterium]